MALFSNETLHVPLRGSKLHVVSRREGGNSWRRWALAEASRRDGGSLRQAAARLQ
ncbi:MAG: hypothetical protein V7K92_18695 [Nostoc sp.]